jgi:uncharacterized repeat protein (TIGR01451 family)
VQQRDISRAVAKRPGATLATLGLFLSSAANASTLAGTEILNVAQASYANAEGDTQVIMSNPVTITVEELIDFVVTTVDEDQQTVDGGDNDVRTQLRIVNLGNGPEGFAITVDETLGDDDFDPTVTEVVLDTNGNGQYDPLEDEVYRPGAEPELNPDEGIDIFVMTKVPVGAVDRERGVLRIDVASTTGTGERGLVFEDAGHGGVDAMLGETGGQVRNDVTLITLLNMPVLEKAQLIEGGDGSGAVITYTLTADFRGAAAKDAVLSDPIPAGTTYVPGSLALSGTALTDFAGDDAGAFDGEAIAVTLTETTIPQTVTFQVMVN